MANTIQLRNSVVKDKTPLPSQLIIGEVCVGAHADSPMLVFKDNADNIVKIEPGSGVTPSPNAPTDPSPGDLWFDTNNNTLNYWNGSDWEVITGDTDSLWKEDGDAVTPKAAGADLKIEGNITAAGAALASRLATGSSDNGVTQTTSYAITAYNNSAGTETIYARNHGDGPLFRGRDSANNLNVEINSDGNVNAAGTVTASNTGDVISPDPTGIGCTMQPGGELYLSRNPANSGVVYIYKTGEAGAKITLSNNGNASFQGDVSIGDATAAFLDKAAAIAALTEQQRTLFATAIAAWNAKPEPYAAEDPTTLPADTPLREAIIRATTAGKINLNSDGSITAAGDLLVGTTSARGNIKFNGNAVDAFVQHEHSGNQYSGPSILSYSSADYDPVLSLGVSKSSTPGTNALVGPLWELGKVQFVGNDGTDFQTAAVIDAQADGTPAAGSMPGALRFSTSPDGSVNPVERLKIDSTGAATFAGTVTAATFDLDSLASLPA